MFSARWAHRSLVGICLVIASALAVYAAWEGAFGPAAQQWAGRYIDPLLEMFPHGVMLERGARFLGAVGTVMTAAFGIYKGLYYADRNLPERLRQMLARTDERLRDRQPILAAIMDDAPAPSAIGAVFYVGPLNRALKEIGYGKHAAAAASLDSAVQELERQLGVSEVQRQNFEEQKVAAHIMRGSIASARAEYNASNVAVAEKDRRLAEREFDLALALRPKDLDALELRGRQRILLKNQKGAFDDFERLARAAHSEKLPVRAARAFRLQAEAYAMSGEGGDRIRARSALLEAQTVLEKVPGTLGAEGKLERGKIGFVLGRVQFQLRHFRVARASLTEARKNLARFPGEGRRLNEIRRMLELIEAAPRREAQ